MMEMKLLLLLMMMMMREGEGEGEEEEEEEDVDDDEGGILMVIDSADINRHNSQPLMQDLRCFLLIVQVLCALVVIQSGV